MKLKFTRRLNKSEKNRAAQITIPRCIALAWSEFDAIDLIYDGSCLIVAPSQ